MTSSGIDYRDIGIWVVESVRRFRKIIDIWVELTE